MERSIEPGDQVLLQIGNDTYTYNISSLTETSTGYIINIVDPNNPNNNGKLRFINNLWQIEGLSIPHQISFFMKMAGSVKISTY